MTKLPFGLDEAVGKLKGFLSENGFEISAEKSIAYGKQFSISDGENQSILRVYHSKKKGTSVDFSALKPDSFLRKVTPFVEECFGVKSQVRKVESVSDTRNGDPDVLIGTDESGKGDYFGPLVIAGVFVDKENGEALRSLGVQDSKALGDEQCKLMSEAIKKLPHSVVAIGPEKYNELYAKIKNLNKLLAWGHARVIENILEEVDCSYVLSDQFGDESLIQNALLKKGRGVTLSQRPRAEENIAVAAASILARDGFLAYMDRLSKAHGMKFPKGANPHVISAGKKLVSAHGPEMLKMVAKLHFKTTSQII